LILIFAQSGQSSRKSEWAPVGRGDGELPAPRSKQMEGLRLIVGLGNPGPEHARTRHNAGFRFVDALADKAGGRFGLDGKLFGETTKVDLAGRDVWLLKPATFMNLSGKSIAAALRYWKIEPEQSLLVHDELDLPPGVARLKFDGGHGGQNGLRDTIRLLGHGKFHRLRIGIGHPGHKDKVTPWVLGRPSVTDDALIGRAVDDALDALPLAVQGNFLDAMTRLHTPKT
jgi:PTH1 family peptidyl-tRNA hydrolase